MKKDWLIHFVGRHEWKEHLTATPYKRGTKIWFPALCGTPASYSTAKTDLAKATCKKCLKKFEMKTEVKTHE